jgi:hypothetical protein
VGGGAGVDGIGAEGEGHGARVGVEGVQVGGVARGRGARAVASMASLIVRERLSSEGLMWGLGNVQLLGEMKVRLHENRRGINGA